MSERINSGLNSSLNNINLQGENVVSGNNIVNNNSNPEAQRLNQPEGSQGLNANQPDSGVDDYLNGNANSSLIAGRGQAQNFANRHEVTSGKDWDFTDPESVRDLVKESFDNIKKSVDGKDVLDNLDKKVTDEVDEFLKGNSQLTDSFKSSVLNDLTRLKQDIAKLREARSKLTKGLSSSAEGNDPIAQLQIMKKTLRVFRYETQKILNKNNPGSKQMDFFEGKLRGIQNLFTFGVKDHVSEQDFEDIKSLEAKLESSLADLNTKLQRMDSQFGKVRLPEGFALESTIEETLEISHRTNDQIRIFEKEHANKDVLRKIITPYAEKGGKRTVEFTAGLGAFLGLGIEAVTAGVRAGARFKVTGEINCKGKGHPLEVTYRIGGGLELKGLAKFGNEAAKTGGKATAGVGGDFSHFVTRTYPTVEDMILDAERCKLATCRTVGAVIVGGLKKLASGIGGLGTKFFRFLGRHSGEVMQSNKQYLESLQSRGVISALDSVLAKRANPIVVAEQKGWTGQGMGQVSANFGLGVTGSLGVGASVTHSRDFNVKSSIFVPFTKLVTGAKDVDSLKSLLRPGPDGVTIPELPQETSDLNQRFEEVLATADKNNNVTKDGWAKFANQVRTLMVAVEIRCREGKMSREDADRLLNRMSNPSVKIPQDVFREYLMDGSPAGKPPKIRTSAQVKIKLSVLNDVTGGMTKDIGNTFVKAVADGAVKEMRHQIGFDSSYQYVYTSEKPSPSSQDARPWEQDEKTSHALVVSNAAPFRAIIDIATKIAAGKGQPPELQTENTLLENAKQAGIDSLKDAGKGATTKIIINTLIAGVKEGAKAAVINYLSKPENIDKIMTWIEKNAGKAFDTVLKIVEWAATHPETAMAIAEQAIAMVKGTSSLIESERTKTVRFNYVNGELDSIGVFTNSSSSIGVNIDPLGVGVGVGFDVKYSVSESLKDRGILVNPSLNTLLSLTESYTLSDTSIRTVENSEPLKNYLAKNIFAIKGNFEAYRGDKATKTYEQARALCSGDPQLLEKLESSWAKLKAVNANTPDNEIVDALHDFLMATTRAYRITLPVEEAPVKKVKVEAVPEQRKQQESAINIAAQVLMV